MSVSTIKRIIIIKYNVSVKADLKISIQLSKQKFLEGVLIGKWKFYDYSRVCFFF